MVLKKLPSSTKTSTRESKNRDCFRDCRSWIASMLGATIQARSSAMHEERNLPFFLFETATEHEKWRNRNHSLRSSSPQLLYPWGCIRTKEQTHLFRHGTTWVLLFNSYVMLEHERGRTKNSKRNCNVTISFFFANPPTPQPLHRHLVRPPELKRCMSTCTKLYNWTGLHVNSCSNTVHCDISSFNRWFS